MGIKIITPVSWHETDLVSVEQLEKWVEFNKYSVNICWMKQKCKIFKIIESLVSDWLEFEHKYYCYMIATKRD